MTLAAAACRSVEVSSTSCSTIGEYCRDVVTNALRGSATLASNAEANSVSACSIFVGGVPSRISDCRRNPFYVCLEGCCQLASLSNESSAANDFAPIAERKKTKQRVGSKAHPLVLVVRCGEMICVGTIASQLLVSFENQITCDSIQAVLTV